MTELLLEALVFFLPAGMSNMAPVFANKIPLINRWNTPMDFGKKYKGKRILGDNKRWRGLIIGAIMASLTAALSWLVLGDLLPYQNVGQALLIGGLMGFGALFGDAVESFFKRLSGVSPGESWFPFDQLDYIAGGLLFIVPFIQLSDELIVVTIIMYFGLHLGTSYLGYLMKLKDQPI
jgi:CDP-2,3-bis-(O-geranylgeranyl)-sn-glycerol synthase